MPRGGAHFTSEELADILDQYDMGVIHQITPLSAGNRRAPKVIVSSERGKFLIKRRPKGRDDIYRVTFAHAVQEYLTECDFPATRLVPTNHDGSTILEFDDSIYECFEYVNGARYNQSRGATVDSGLRLAEIHLCLKNFEHKLAPLKGSFHDSTSVRRHLKTIGSRSESKKKYGLRGTIDELTMLYNDASVRVNQRGFDSWEKQIVHGDWHPGNMLFSGHRIVAVLDFDSVKIAPTVTDIANGMLQFSIVGNRPNPADWPAYLDQARLVWFLTGYRNKIALDDDKLYSLPDLMIETIIAEAVLPVAATGFFGNLSGREFLEMIKRKAQWLDNHRDKIDKTIRYSSK